MQTSIGQRNFAFYGPTVWNSLLIFLARQWSLIEYVQQAAENSSFRSVMRTTGTVVAVCGQHKAPLWRHVDNIRHRCGVMWTASSTIVALCGQHQAPLWLYVDNIRQRCGVMWTTSGTVVAFLAPSTNVLMHLHTSCSHALHSDQPAFIDIFGLLCNFVITFIEQQRV